MAGPAIQPAEPPGPSAVGPDGAPEAVTPSAAGVTAPDGTVAAGHGRQPAYARSRTDSAPGSDRLLPVGAGGGSIRSRRPSPP